jgi:6-pyruvoyltetrahydropterin/6-carboxytetrahydropterin synthase
MSSTTVVRDHTFEAAHFLPHVPPGHPCGRVHGHSYKVEIHVTGPVHDTLGWVVDFGDIDALMAPLIGQLDHHLLNDIEGLKNPTVEILAAWLWQRLAGPLPQLCAIVVHESTRARCLYKGPQTA